MMYARVADTPTLRNAAGALVRRQYEAAGYGSPELPVSACSTTLVAINDETVVGTLTVTVDGPGGLLVDHAYREFVDDRRMVDCVCAEITKLAFDRNAGGHRAIDIIFKLAIETMTARGATDLFIEVNPDHSTFYERRLAFWAIGKITLTDRVNAPAQLLWIDLRRLRRSITDRRINGARGERRLA